MDRRYEIEVLRRSVAMLTPGTRALTREQALDLLEELQDVQRRLAALRAGLRKLVDEAGPAPTSSPAGGGPPRGRSTRGR